MSNLLRIDPWNGENSSGVTYYGYANPGVLDNEQKWRITRKYNGKTQYPLDSNKNVILDSNLLWSNRSAYTYTLGGSIQFNSFPSVLTISNDIDFRFGTGDFTIEWWQYQTDNNPYTRIFGQNSWPNETIAVSIEAINTTTSKFYFWINKLYTHVSDVTNFKNKWTHFAISRNSNSIRFFQDGNQLGTGITSAYDFNDSTSTLGIGNHPTPTSTTQFTGNITNFRWIKGAGLYTSNFTVPTSQLLPTNETKLLLLASDTAYPFKDYSSLNKTVNNTNAIWSDLTPF